MALGTKKNVIVGAAVIGLHDTPTTTTPTLTRAQLTATVGANGVKTPTNGWYSVGFTQDGVEISTDPSYGEVEVDQLMDAALIFKDGMSMSISTTFAEATLENLMIAWGQSTTSLASTVDDAVLVMQGGALGDAPVERSLVAIGNAPRKTDASNTYGERLYHAYRVLSVESSSHSLARADATVIPVTFRAMPDDSGDYGLVVDTFGT
jgi:hypothetical protein